MKIEDGGKAVFRIDRPLDDGDVCGVLLRNVRDKQVWPVAPGQNPGNVFGSRTVVTIDRIRSGI